MKYINILLLAALCLSCNSKKENESIDVLPTGKQRILVDYKEAISIFSIDDIVDDLSFIPLEKTEPYIGNIKKLIQVNDSFIIWDSNGKTIWVFDLVGKLKTRIYKLGKGPDEYLEITNVSINSQGNIQIADASRKSIISYSLSGAFLDRQTLDCFPSDYIENEGYKYVFYHHIPSNTKEKNYVNIYKGHRKLTGYFPFIHTWQYDKDRFIKQKNNIFFYRSYDNNIYRFNKDKLQVSYKLDFGKFNNVNAEIRKCQNLNEFYDIRNKGRYVGNISNLTISENHLAFRYDVVNNGAIVNYNYIYDLKNGNFYNYKGAKTDKYRITPGLPITCEKNICYSFIEAWQFSNELREELSLKYKTDINKSSNPIIMKFQYNF